MKCAEEIIAANKPLGPKVQHIDPVAAGQKSQFDFSSPRFEWPEELGARPPLPVLRLQPILAAVYQQDPVTADPVACQSGQSLLHGFWKTRRRDVEAKLDGCRDLVDVLASGSGGPDKTFLDLTFVER